VAGTAMVQDQVTFYGHPNIRSLHAKTIEITKDEHLTPRGDCIIGVKADKACADLDQSVKHRLKSNSSLAKMELIVGDESFLVSGMGDERLSMLNAHDIVIRKTNFVCPRTMSVLCDQASSDIPRKLVKMLQDQETKGIFRITLE
jgi:uncharacterized protein